MLESPVPFFLLLRVWFLKYILEAGRAEDSVLLVLVFMNTKCNNPLYFSGYCG